MLSTLSECFILEKRSISLSTRKLVKETSQFIKINSYQSASVNLPGIISLLVGGGADVWAGVFVLSWRLLLDMFTNDGEVFY